MYYAKFKRKKFKKKQPQPLSSTLGVNISALQSHNAGTQSLPEFLRKSLLPLVGALSQCRDKDGKQHLSLPLSLFLPTCPLQPWKHPPTLLPMHINLCIKWIGVNFTQTTTHLFSVWVQLGYPAYFIQIRWGVLPPKEAQQRTEIVNELHCQILEKT